MRTVSDSTFKVHRISGDLVLGLTGDHDVITELREAIKSNVGTFRRLTNTVIPAHMAAFVARYPHAKFSVALLGNDNGVVRGAAWGCSDPATTFEGCAGPDSPVNCLVLGPMHKADVDALRAVNAALIKGKSELPPDGDANTALAFIYADLARKYPAELNATVWTEYVHASTRKDIGTGQTQPDLFVEPGDTDAVLFEASSRLTGFAGDQIWIGACGAGEDWGSANIYVSRDDLKYAQVGTIDTPARLGTLHADLAAGTTDPDTTGSLVVDLIPGAGAIDAGTTADADAGATLCFVDGEIIAYSAAAISGPEQYTMDTYLRRGPLTTYPRVPGQSALLLTAAAPW
jgi:hypothetical protein